MAHPEPSPFLARTTYYQSWSHDFLNAKMITDTGGARDVTTFATLHMATELVRYLTKIPSWSLIYHHSNV